VATVSVVTPSVSKTNPDIFSQFLPRYWNAIASMDPLPDQVVIAHSINDYCGVTNIPEGFPVKVKLIPVNATRTHDFGVAAMDAVETDWISFCGLDDQMLPDAYKDIQAATEADADILVGGIKLSVGTDVMGRWALESIKYANNIAAHCPFTKRLYDRLGPWPDIRWNDWGWWAKCYKENVNVYHTDTRFVIFDVGADHPTESGIAFAGEERSQADIEVKKFIEELGI